MLIKIFQKETIDKEVENPNNHTQIPINSGQKKYDVIKTLRWD